MKTALEQLIDTVKEIRSNYNASGKLAERRMYGAYTNVIVHAKSLLPTERQQIIDAFNNGYKNGKIDIEDGTLFNDGNDYYTQTFKDK